MSSNCPPQLHLELPPSTTSFKRSFDQFGFDLESPLGASDAVGSSLNDGNDRNKRARSASSFSDDDRSIESSSSSTLASASSSMSPGSANDSSLSSHILTAPRLTVPHLSLNIARSSLEPPRLPTPEIQDIDMTDYPLPEPEGVEEETSTSRTVVSTTSNASQAEENYRLSLERFNAFDTQISALRRSRSPSLPRAQTPPPVLPPLELLGAEAPINTNTISFLHPPAQPSPPLPHALYNYGPPRIQPSGSRTVSRNESLLDDPRRLPHETHLPPLPLVESSTASRGDPHPEEWDRITQNVRPTRDEGIGWNFWPPAAEEEDHDTEEEDNEEEEEEEVQEALEQHIGARVWSSPIPNLGELLRTPTPFNPLDDLEFHHPPSVPSPRRREDTAPPTLPPIEDEVLSPIWQEPTLEEALDDAWGRWPNERPTSRSSLRSTSTQSHPPTPRLATLDRLPLLSERERAIIAEDISEAEATVGSSTTDETLPAQSGPPSSPLHEWLENPWFLRPDEPGPSARAEVETSTTHSNDSFNSGSGSSILDNYAAQRLQALQGIGTALEGIGQALRESELSFRPYLRDNAHSGETAATATDEGTNTSQNSSQGRPSPARTSAWRSTSGPGESSSSVDSVRRLARLSIPPMPSPIELRPYLDFDFSYPTEPSERSPPLDTAPSPTNTEVAEALFRRSSWGRSTADNETLQDALERYTRQAPSASDPNSIDALRSRAEALEAAVRQMDERLRDEHRWIRRRSPSLPLHRLFPRDDHASNIPRRDGELPTNASMLFHDRPSPVVSQHNTQAYDPSSRLQNLENALPPRSTPLSRLTSSASNADNRSPERGSDRDRIPTWADVIRGRESDRTRARLSRSTLLNSSGSPLFAGSAMSNLRARPYVSQSSTHAHGHSYSQALSSQPPLSAAPGESVADAQRRIARLGFMQMSRQRSQSNNGTTARAEPSSSPVSTFGNMPPPLYPDGRRQSYGERMAEERANFLARFSSLRSRRERDERSRETDRSGEQASQEVSGSPTRSLRRTSLHHSDTTGLSNNETRSRNESSPERSIPPGLRFLRRLSEVNRPERGANGMLIDPPSLDRPETTYRRWTSDVYPPSPVEASAMYLPIPSLPSPGLELDSEISSLSSNAAEQPSSNLSHIHSHPVSTERSLSPQSPLRRRLSSMSSRICREVSSPDPPTSSVSREIDPESFAPGPFRNTIQSLWGPRNRTHSSDPRSHNTAIGPQAHVTPPSLPPLAFEIENGHSGVQRSDRPDSGFLHQNDNDGRDNSAGHLRAFLRRHPLPQTTPQRPDILNTIFSTPDNLPTSSSPETLIEDPRPTWLYDEGTARSDWPTPYPPWRATQPPRVSPPEPSPSSSSELHDFLTRHPRSEALRREAEAAWGTPALRGDDEGFGRAVHALRHEVSSASRSQEPLHRARDVPQEPRTTWAPPMQWGTLEQGQAGSNHTNDSLLARRRRYPPLAGYFDDEDVESAFDRARFWARRSRGSGEAPVFPRRIGPLVRTGGPGAGYRRARPLGDYIRDEDWNGDYDTLISLAATLGDVKPRSTSDDVMATLETGLFKEWQTPESDHRCPICLDDYQADDILLKLADCSHWLHHECLRQWLKNATTCPVCRESVNPRSSGGHRDEPRDGSSNSSSGDGGPSAASGHSGFSSRLDPRRRRFS